MAEEASFDDWSTHDLIQKLLELGNAGRLAALKDAQDWEKFLQKRGKLEQFVALYLLGVKKRIAEEREFARQYQHHVENFLQDVEKYRKGTLSEEALRESIIRELKDFVSAAKKLGK